MLSAADLTRRLSMRPLGWRWPWPPPLRCASPSPLGCAPALLTRALDSSTSSTAVRAHGHLSLSLTRSLSSLSPSSSASPSVDFASLPLSSALLCALREGGWLRCTEVQARALPHLLPHPTHSQALIAGRTGEGKTLAALIPAFERAIDAERRLREEGQRRVAWTAADALPPVWDSPTGAVDASAAAAALPPPPPLLQLPPPPPLYTPPSPARPSSARLFNASPSPPLSTALSALSSTPSLLRPLSVVLVPSRELVSQWLCEAKLLARTLPVRVERLSAERPTRKEKRDLGLVQRRRRPQAEQSTADGDRALPRPISLLICTPHRLQAFLRRRLLSLSSVRTFIVDEADVLLEGGGGFSEEVVQLLHTLRQQSNSRRGAGEAPLLLFLAASVPSAVLSTLRTLCPSLLDCSSPTLHSLPAALPLRFVPVTATSKMEALVREVKGALAIDASATSRVLVFCNSIPSCRAVEAALSTSLSSPSLVASSHGSLPSTLRRRHFAAFLRGDGVVRVLVCTDLASRGLDLPFLTRVIQFDLAANATDFLHRVGRLRRHSRAQPQSQLPLHLHPRQGQQEAVSLVLPAERSLASSIQSHAAQSLHITSASAAPPQRSSAGHFASTTASPSMRTKRRRAATTETAVERRLTRRGGRGEGGPQRAQRPSGGRRGRGAAPAGGQRPSEAVAKRRQRRSVG